jgi:SAM-dependent methyltransferase
MGRFWDARAREDAMFFVDDREPYGAADAARFWDQGERDLDHILDALGAGISEGDTVVDVGCGVGRLTRVIAGRAARVYAIDVSAEMLAQARDHNGHLDTVEWVHGDGTTLQPIPDGVADAVVSHVVFQHIPDPAITYGYVAEMGRVLRPGGWAAFQVSNDPSIHRPHGEHSRLRAVLGREPAKADVEDPAWIGSAVELDELRATAGAAGMDMEQTIGEGTQYCGVRLRRRSRS